MNWELGKIVRTNNNLAFSPKVWNVHEATRRTVGALLSVWEVAVIIEETKNIYLVFVFNGKENYVQTIVYKVNIAKRDLKSNQKNRKWADKCAK